MNLTGKRILITRPREQYAEFAEKLLLLGAIPVSFPVIAIQPIAAQEKLKQALYNLQDYHWVIFTSVNGVGAVWKTMQAIGLPGFPGGVQVAAIGPATVAALSSINISVNFVPGEYVAEAILPGLGDLEGKQVLLLRADIARPDLADAIRLAGGAAHEIAVYHTVRSDPTLDEWTELEKGVDFLTFTSASTVKNFLEIIAQRNFDLVKLLAYTKVSCIGPVTAQAARENGLRVDIEADVYTIDGLIAALLSYEWNDQATK